MAKQLEAYPRTLEPYRHASTMSVESYLGIFRRLGFTQAERGSVLKHPSRDKLKIYLNWNRDREVYFTSYLKIKERFPCAYWLRCKPMQKVDDLPKFITLVPLQGLEAIAIAGILDGTDA
jgi:hypothetical protein